MTDDPHKPDAPDTAKALIVADSTDALQTTLTDLGLDHTETLEAPQTAADWLERQDDDLVILNADALDALRDRQAALQSEIASLREELAHSAITDPTTEIASLSYFTEFLDRRWRAHARRDDEPISLLLIEPDDFDALREASSGEQVDRCLRQIARTIESCATRADDIAARCGDHTFAMVLSGTGEEGAETIARKLRDAVESLQIPHPDGHVSISVGIATAVPDATTGQRRFVAAAEQALETAQG